MLSLGGNAGRRLSVLLLLTSVIAFSTFRSAFSRSVFSSIGPFNVSTMDLGTKRSPLPQFAPWHITVWYPTALPGTGVLPKPLPTIVFVSSFAGTVATSEFGDLLSQVSSQGRVVVGVDRTMPLVNKENGSSGIDYALLARQLGPVLDWVSGSSPSTLSSLSVALSNKGAVAAPDAKRLILAGHSAGNHVLVERLVDEGCEGRIAGTVLVDAVDGEDPYGRIKNFVIHPPSLVNFSTPALVISTDLDPVGGLFGKGPACAPANMSNARFLNAWRGPAFLLNFTDWGHMDLVQPESLRFFYHSACPGYPVLRKGAAAAAAAYRKDVAVAISAFCDGVLAGNATQFEKVLSQTNVWSNRVEARQRNWKAGEGVEARCTEVSED